MNFTKLMSHAQTAYATAEDFHAIMQQDMSRGAISDKALIRAVNTVLPNNTLVITDAEERSRRKELSERMRSKMLRLAQYAQMAKIQRASDPRGKRKFENMRDMLTTLNLPYPSQTEEYFRRSDTLASGTPKEKAKLLMQTFRDAAKGFDRARLMNMTDEQLLENLEAIAHLSHCAAEGRKLANNKDIDLTDAERQELREYQDKYAIATWLENRASVIATNGYSVLDIDRLDAGNVSFDNLPLSYEEQEAVSDICNTAASFNQMASTYIDDEIMRELEGNACDQITWTDADGNTIQPNHKARSLRPNGYDPPSDMMFEGKDLVAQFPNGSVKVFSLRHNPNGTIPFKSEPLHAMMDRYVPKKMQALSKDLETADPWYVKSSPEFKRVQTKLKEAQKYWSAFNGKPTERQLKSLHVDMKDLQEACRAYLDTKEGKTKSSELEKQRIAAVQSILQFTQTQNKRIITFQNQVPVSSPPPEVMAFTITERDREARQQQISENIKPFPNAVASRIVPDKPADLPVQEFTENAALIEKVGLSNDPAQLQAVLDGKDPVKLSDSDRRFLNHRIDRLNAVHKFEQNLPPKQLRGKPVHGKDAHALWLSGVTQPKKQSTGNGCWSVSLQSQLAFRGVEIDQTTIRAMRPGNQSSRNYMVTDAQLNKDSSQTLGDYSNLVHRLLPNTAVHTISVNSGNVPAQQDRIALLRDIVTLGLEKHQSPVSIVFGNHYRTIFGIDDNNIYVKNPLNPDPAHCTPIPISNLKNTAFQLSWLQDLKPSLSGDTPMLGSCSVASGNSYCGGKLIFNEREYTDAFDTIATQTDYRTASGRNIRIESYLPDKLRYRRPKDAAPDDFALNLDALQTFRDQIAPLAERSEAYQPLQNAIDTMLNAPQTTHENLYALAKAYQTALTTSAQELRGNPGSKDLEAAHKLLTEQAKAVRGSLVGYLNFRSQKLLHDPSKSYLDDPKEWADIQNGMVAMLHDATAGNLPIEDPRWLNLLAPGPNGRERSLAQFRKDERVNALLEQFHDRCEAERSQGGPRKSTELKSALRGGDMLPLIQEFATVSKQLNSQQPAKENTNRMERSKSSHVKGPKLDQMDTNSSRNSMGR